MIYGASFFLLHNVTECSKEKSEKCKKKLQGINMALSLNLSLMMKTNFRFSNFLQWPEFE